VIQRKTQTAIYWQEHFEFTTKDVGHIYDLVVDKGTPTSTAELAQTLIERHCRREEDRLRAELSSGQAYQPKDKYEVGEKLIFPAQDFLTGVVTDTRPGSNPDYGDFTVIQVQMEGTGRIREFASELEGVHTLNRGEGDNDLLVSDDLLAVSELYELYGPLVEEELVTTLSEQDEFIPYRDGWFLRDMLAPIHAIHLNIAEAWIEVRGMPLPTAEFLSDLDLPAEIPEEIQILSLNLALEDDERFDNVGDSGRDIWYLRRLAPEPVANPPARLALSGEPYDRREIDHELLAIEREIDDEGSGEEVLGPSRKIYGTTITLTYPHWRCGTLPLTVRTRGLFLQAPTHHTPVVLVDGESGTRMQGWIVHEESFVYGLEDWYRSHQLPVGARIKLERTRDPRVITVNFWRQRLKRPWVRVASAQSGKLVFQMRKLPVSCEYDELLSIAEDDAAAMDDLWSHVSARGDSLLEILIQIMPELVKLSPQGTVHAKTIYSAANVLKRVAPGPVFALLSTEPCFVSMGGGYWAFDEALIRS
jgi:hypothetical protein